MALLRKVGAKVYSVACFVITEDLNMQCLKCGWTVLDGVQALLFKAGRHPATS